MAEENEDMMSGMAGGMKGMIILVLIVGIMGMYAPPTPTIYTCSLCGAEFGSLVDLQTHFDTAHLGEPIDIVWE